MNQHLILVKHSLPEIVEELPASEWKLSENGRERAQRLAKRLNLYRPEVIVSSIEPKAKETAEIIAREHQLDFQIVGGLHEHDRSKASFLPKDGFRMAVREFFEKPDALVFGNETANQSYARFNQAVYFVLNLHKDKTIAIIAHGTVISLFVSRLAGISDFCFGMNLVYHLLLSLIRNHVC